MQPDTQWFIYKRPVEDPYVLIGQVSTCVYQSLTELLNIFPVMNQSFILWCCQWKTGRLPEGKSQERILVRKDVKEWREHGVELVEGSDGGLLRGRHAAAAEVVVLLMVVGHRDSLAGKKSDSSYWTASSWFLNPFLTGSRTAYRHSSKIPIII